MKNYENQNGFRPVESGFTAYLIENIALGYIYGMALETREDVHEHINENIEHYVFRKDAFETYEDALDCAIMKEREIAPSYYDWDNEGEF